MKADPYCGLCPERTLVPAVASIEGVTLCEYHLRKLAGIQANPDQPKPVPQWDVRPRVAS